MDQKELYRKKKARKLLEGQCAHCSRPKFHTSSRCFTHWLRYRRPSWLGGNYHHGNPFYMHEVGLRSQQRNFNIKAIHNYLPNIWKVWECCSLLMLDDRMRYSHLLDIITKLQYEEDENLSVDMMKMLAPYADKVFTYEDVKDMDSEWLRGVIDQEGPIGYSVINDRGYKLGTYYAPEDM